MLKIITWDELGNPTEEGPVTIQKDWGPLIIYVEQQDIKRAAKYGNNPTFELIDVSAVKDEIPLYRLGQIRR